MSWVSEKACVITIANFDDWNNKSIVSINLAIGLMLFGYKVLYLDANTTSHDLHNNLHNKGGLFAQLQCLKIGDTESLIKSIESYNQSFEFIIVDAPCALNDLSRQAHNLADLLITPLNGESLDQTRSLNLGEYGEFIWQIRKQRGPQEEELKWWVLYNYLVAEQKPWLELELKKMSKLLRFKYLSGLNHGNIDEPSCESDVLGDVIEPTLGSKQLRPVLVEIIKKAG